jgi:hypothetical protein
MNAALESAPRIRVGAASDSVIASSSRRCLGGPGQWCSTTVAIGVRRLPARRRPYRARRAASGPLRNRATTHRPRRPPRAHRTGCAPQRPRITTACQRRRHALWARAFRGWCIKANRHGNLCVRFTSTSALSTFGVPYLLDPGCPLHHAMDLVAWARRQSTDDGAPHQHFLGALTAAIESKPMLQASSALAASRSRSLSGNQDEPHYLHAISSSSP